MNCGRGNCCCTDRNAARTLPSDFFYRQGRRNLTSAIDEIEDGLDDLFRGFRDMEISRCITATAERFERRRTGRCALDCECSMRDWRWNNW